MTVEIRYQSFTASLDPRDTVLDALERAGADLPSSCRAGACHFCMLRVVDGVVPEMSQEPLKPALRETGHFLACICRPTSALTCEPANAARFRGFVTIAAFKSVTKDVKQVHFFCPQGFDFTPGQFVTLRRDDGLARSYAITSPATDDQYFSIYVRRVESGRLSAWFHDGATSGMKLWMEGPKGNCIYFPEQADEPLTLVGTGTGMAPLLAIAHDAVTQGHRGALTIYQGALPEAPFYFADELNTLAAEHHNVTYKPGIVDDPGRTSVSIIALKRLIYTELKPAPLRWVYLCVDAGLVRSLKKHLFLAGPGLDAEPSSTAEVSQE